MNLRQIRRSPPQHLVLHLQLTNPPQLFRKLTTIHRVRRRGHATLSEFSILHPLRQGTLLDTQIGTRRFLRHPRLHQRNRVRFELWVISRLPHNNNPLPHHQPDDADLD